MKHFYLAILILTYAQSILHAHFSENTPEANKIKVFVRPENVQLTENGIYLSLATGQRILLPNIQSDGYGLFTTLNDQDARKYSTYICPGCHVTYYWWENCNTAGCPYSRQK
jgi:hypothetical protein